jgi:hypothetical protein
MLGLYSKPCSLLRIDFSVYERVLSFLLDWAREGTWPSLMLCNLSNLTRVRSCLIRALHDYKNKELWMKLKSSRSWKLKLRCVRTGADGRYYCCVVIAFHLTPLSTQVISLMISYHRPGLWMVLYNVLVLARKRVTVMLNKFIVKTNMYHRYFTSCLSSALPPVTKQDTQKESLVW